MLHCSYAGPMRQRIYDMKGRYLSDDYIVNAIVREQGIVALAAPPAEGFGGILTWVMPGVVLVLGFFVYTWYVRRNQKAPAPLSASDQAIVNRYQDEMNRELEESPDAGARRPDNRT